MRYDKDALERLRGRWHQPLGRDAGAVPEEVRSFHELLRRRLEAISERVRGARLRIGEQAEPRKRKEALQEHWKDGCRADFEALLEELHLAGLDGTVAMGASEYEVRAPYDLRGADLRGLALCGAALENARFEGADLRGASLEAARCFETRFEDSLCTQAVFSLADCHFSHFQGADCDRASFEGADCSMVRFEQARLRHALFDEAVCFAARFDGAFLGQASLAGMRINHLTGFGHAGELREAKGGGGAKKKNRNEGQDWYIADLFPLWLRAAEVNAQVRSLLKAHGYYLEADEYQYLEMVCRRHVLCKHRVQEFFEWFFKDMMFGYGLKWRRPLISVLAIILLWALGFTLHFRLAAGDGVLASLGQGLYYSVISFTTLGFGNAPDLQGFWPKVLLCTEALLGTVLMPLFLLAYARKILQD